MKMPLVPLVKNFGHSVMSLFLLENLKVVYSVVSKTSGKFFYKNKIKYKGNVCMKMPFCLTSKEF